MKTTKEILIEARTLIAEKGWCQGMYARDAEGHAIDERSPDAAYYCSLGALMAATGGYVQDRLYSAVVDPSGVASIVEFNDKEGRTKEEILAFFDRAIAAQP